jgi:transcriptional regulator with XRE-family HTH domain
MRKSIYSDEYQVVLDQLVAMRKAAGLTQRDLARKLGREHSFVSRIEKGERRLDVVEFHWVCQALDQNAGTVYQQLVRSFSPPPRTLYPAANPVRKVAEK